MRDMMNELRLEFEGELGILKKPLEFKKFLLRYPNYTAAQTHRVSITVGRRTGFMKRTDQIAHSLCHELGHLIGGAPKSRTHVGAVLGSVEGQADYFTTAKCLKRLWRDEDNETIMKDVALAPGVNEACSSVYPA